MDEYSKEPCPYRIADDVGAAFAVGLIGSSLFQSVTGFRTSAKGQKLKGALREVRFRSPATAVQFAAWSVPNSRVLHDRSGLMAVRSGPRMMAASAALGGFIFSMLEAANLISTRWMSKPLKAQQPELEDPRNLPSKSPWIEDMGHNKVFVDRGLRAEGSKTLRIDDIGHNKDTAPFGPPL
uniref:Transmembrane protein n=1 Tax=Steinernema glaseri TaxID=37863 RepID=A0A1I7Z1A9_9BILA